MLISKIVSGGQSGADRAALDWALANGLSHGGWCPAGRRSEDGRISLAYMLAETPGSGYRQRTNWNVRDSDGTLIISLSRLLTGGSAATQRSAQRLGRPCLHVTFGDECQDLIGTFIREHSVQVLNVAGPRESKEPGVYQAVGLILTRAFLST